MQDTPPGALKRDTSGSQSQSHSQHNSPLPNMGASPTVPSVKGVCPVGLPTSEAYTVQCTTECLKDQITRGMWLDEMAYITNGRAVGETIRLCGASSIYIRFKENKTGYPLAFSLPKHVLVPYSTTASSANQNSSKIGGHSNTFQRHDSGLGLPFHPVGERIGVSPTSAFASSHDMQTMLMSHSINHHNRREGIGSLSPVPNLNGVGGTSKNGAGGKSLTLPASNSATSSCGVARADGTSEVSNGGSRERSKSHYAAMHASKDHHDHVPVHEGAMGGPLLCVVCGIWGCPKRQGTKRNSGYKCKSCVGKASLPRLRSEFQRLLTGKIECST